MRRPGPDAGGQREEGAAHVAREAAAAQREDVAVQAVVHVVARDARGDAHARHRAVRREGAPAPEEGERAVDAAAQREREGAPATVRLLEVPVVVEHERHVRRARGPEGAVGPAGRRSRPGGTRA